MYSNDNTKGSAVNSQLVQTSDCFCPEYNVTYECTVCGSGVTLWTGSIFHCPGNEIVTVLRHLRFASGASGECNDGSLLVTARSVRVVRTNNMDCYISQLTVMSTTHFTDINNKTVTCIHDHNTVDINETVIATAKFAYLTGE